MLAAGKTTEEVQQITGYSRIWIDELLKRYNQLGVKGLGGRRQKNTVRQSLNPQTIHDRVIQTMIVGCRRGYSLLLKWQKLIQKIDKIKKDVQ